MSHDSLLFRSDFEIQSVTVTGRLSVLQMEVPQFLINFMLQLLLVSLNLDVAKA